MAAWPRIQWYTLLASKYMRTVQVEIIKKPLRISALSLGSRFDGTDFVLRCLRVEAPRRRRLSSRSFPARSLESRSNIAASGSAVSDLLIVPKAETPSERVVSCVPFEP